MSKAVIFDFDGTLVDSEKTIYKCFKSITEELAPERINYAKNILIGPPLRDTASQILGPIHHNLIDQFIRQFIEMHDDHAIFSTQPYLGVNELLKKLAFMKIPMAIATNKRKNSTIKLIEHIGWARYFYLIECRDSQLTLRNKDEMIRSIINENNLFMNSYFVGDTVNDGLSANLNQLNFIHANYGYGGQQDWANVKIKKTINAFAELDSIII